MEANWRRQFWDSSSFLHSLYHTKLTVFENKLPPTDFENIPIATGNNIKHDSVSSNRLFSSVVHFFAVFQSPRCKIDRLMSYFFELLANFSSGAIAFFTEL